MLRAHKIRLNPTLEQEVYFLQAAGIARFAWNWALNRYKEIKATGEKIDWNEIKKEFRAKIDSDFPFVRDVTKCSPEQAIHDLRQAINTYYKIKKKTPKAKIGFPGFRKRLKKIGGFGLNNDQFKVEGNAAFIPKCGPVNMAESLRYDGKILSGRVKEKAGRWYLTVVVEVEPQPVASLNGSVGIDFGLSRLATLSNGEVCETQAYFRQSERKLKMLQRGLARKKKGSCNWVKWNLRMTRMHERIGNQRSDYLHKFTTGVAKVYGLICIEDLNLKGLTQTRLAKSFNDAGIGEAIRQLEYKSDGNGGLVQRVDRFFPSSKLCHVCQFINHELTLSDRMWICPQCLTRHDRDFNASMNLELEGVRLLVHGNGSVGTLNPPVELAASTLNFGSEQVVGCEAGRTEGSPLHT
jgi:putative transposase